MGHLRDQRSWLSVLCLALLAGGCEVHKVPPPPVSLTQYNQKSENPHPYPKETTLVYNLQRMENPKLTEAERIDSLHLVARLGEDDPKVRAKVANLLGDAQAPQGLRAATLELLLKWDYPDLAGYVVKVLPGMETRSGTREQVLEWLARHPTPKVLAAILKLWAREPSPTGLDEPRFRRVVERLSGKSWERALLEGLNDPGVFYARGSALEILSARLSGEEMKRRITVLTPEHESVLAMQIFQTYYDYLPTSGQTLLHCVWLYRREPGRFEDVGRLYRLWRDSYGYRFDVRDFHLLSHLQRDPIRRAVRRDQLLLELARDFLKRQHVSRPADKPAGPYDFTDRFTKQVDNLSMADLWNLRLLDEMLERPLVQAALSVLAAQDRADRRSAFGGLVFCRNEQAEAEVYPPRYEAGGGDLVYSPTYRLVQDSRDSLCRYVGHFEVLENAARAGPGPEELRDARQNNYYGLVLTTLRADAFCAHYYNPAGVVVSMGTYALREPPREATAGR